MTETRYQPRDDEPKTPVSFRIPKRHAEWIRRCAEQHGITQAHWLSRVLDRAIAEPPTVDESEAA